MLGFIASIVDHWQMIVAVVVASWQRRLGSKTELEFNPHDGVHQAIGGNMSVVALSSRDLIFFLHHANVDRLWSAWNGRGSQQSGAHVARFRLQPELHPILSGRLAT